MKVLHVMAGSGVTSVPMQWVHGLAREGIKADFLSKDGDSYFSGLIKFLSRRIQDYDALHYHHTFGAFICCLSPYRKKSFLSFHRDYRTMGLLSRLLHFFAARRVRGVIVNSNFTKSTLPKSLIDRCRVHVVYNGFSICAGKSRGNLDQLSDDNLSKIKILSVGRLIPEKNYSELIRFVANVNSKTSLSLELKIVGGGRGGRALKQLSKELNADEFIFIVGEKNREYVVAALNEADVFYMPSLTEGYCNAAVEALASEIPVLYAPGGALPEVIGDCGWQASGFSAVDLESNFLRFLKATDHERMSVLERSRVRVSELSLDVTLEKLANLYRMD